MALTVGHGVLFSPLPFEASSRLIILSQEALHSGERLSGVPPADYLDWKEELRSFDGLAAYHIRGVELRGDEGIGRLVAGVVSKRFFSVLGADVTLGRTPTGEPEDGALVVLGHRFWQRSYGGDPAVIGSSIVLWNRSYTVCGVLSEQVSLLLGGADVWVRSPHVVPLPEGPIDNYGALSSSGAARGMAYLKVIGRLRPGVGLKEARQEVRASGAHLANLYPATHEGRRYRLQPLRNEVVTAVRNPLLLVIASSAALFLVAFGSAVNLRGVSILARRRELATRSALGETPSRLVRRLALEALLLTAGGGGLGLLMAFPVFALIRRRVPESVPRIGEISPWPSGVLVALGLVLVSGAILGAASVILGGREYARCSLLQPESPPPQRAKVQGAVVALQVCLALILVLDAAVLVNSMIRLQGRELGFAADRLVVVRVRTSTFDPDQGAMLEPLMSRLTALDSVISAGAISDLPLVGVPRKLPFVSEGESEVSGEPVLAGLHAVSAGLFRRLRVPVVAGREFEARDQPSETPVALVSHRASLALWSSGTDPVGRRLAIARPGAEPWWLTVVGVVEDLPYGGLREAPGADVYLPLSQNPQGVLHLLVRATRDANAATKEIVGVVGDALDTYSVESAQTYSEIRAAATRELRLVTLLVAVFAAGALVLAVSALYGLLHLLLLRHRHEFAVRLALGASRLQIAGDVVGTGLRVLAPGLVIGPALAYWAARLVSHLLYRFAEQAVQVMAVAVALILACSLFAFVPAVRRTLTLCPAEELHDH